MKWDHRKQEIFGAPIHCLLAETELPQSRWLEGSHITLPLPGDFHSAGEGTVATHTTLGKLIEEG